LVWKIEFKPSAGKAFLKLDKPIQKKILKYLNTKIVPQENPRVFGKALSHDKFGLWRYRVEDFRIVCEIRDEKIEIVVVKVAHRKEVYDE
jgi:mRNA interferase RelE/StbE